MGVAYEWHLRHLYDMMRVCNVKIVPSFSHNFRYACSTYVTQISSEIKLASNVKMLILGPPSPSLPNQYPHLIQWLGSALVRPVIDRVR